jgi:hypothetical protein
MNDQQLAAWLSHRLDKCLPIDAWQRESLEKLLTELKK